MQTQIKKLENVIWINIVNPEINEVRKLLVENGMNDNLAEEIVEPTLQAKADTLRNAIFLTLPFPIKREEKTDIEEVDFLIKSNLVISTQLKEINEIRNFVENLDKIEIDHRHNNQKHGGVYFAHFLKTIYGTLNLSLNKVSEEINFIEKNIFSSDERKTIEDIASVSKKIFDFRTSLKQHDEVIKIYSDAAIKIFGIEYNIYNNIIEENYKKVALQIENQRELLNDFKDTINFLISNRTNQITKVFTVVSFVILPALFLASFFGMNTRFPQDLVTSTFGTVYIMGIMFVISVLVLLYLHFKKLI